MNSLHPKHREGHHTWWHWCAHYKCTLLLPLLLLSICTLGKAVTAAVDFPTSPHSGSFHAVTQAVYYRVMHMFTHKHIHAWAHTCILIVFLAQPFTERWCWCLLLNTSVWWIILSFFILLRLQMWTQRISKQLAMSWSRTRLSCSVSSWRLPRRPPPPLLLRHQDPQTEVSWLRCLPNDSRMQLHVSLYITSAHQQLAKL